MLQNSNVLLTQQDFPPNSVITPLTNLSRAPEKAYSSVQHGSGPNDHFELNSDLLFSGFDLPLEMVWTGKSC